MLVWTRMSVASRALLAGALAWMSAGWPSSAEPALVPPPPIPGEELALSSDLRVRVRQGRIIELSVLPGSGEGYAEIAGRVTGDPRLGPVLSDWNGSRSPSPERFVRVPLSLLSGDYRVLILINLFPHDRRAGSDWMEQCFPCCGLSSAYDRKRKTSGSLGCHSERSEESFRQFERDPSLRSG